MEKYISGACSSSIHYALSYCVLGESKRTTVDVGTASVDIERENICLDSEHYLTRLKITNTSGTMLKLLAGYHIMTDDFKIYDRPSNDWMVFNGSRQLNDIPATCILGERDNSFVQCADRLIDEGVFVKDCSYGDCVLYGDGITVIKSGKTYVSLEILTSENQLTDISISMDCNGDIKAIRLGGEFNCLMEDGDIKYTDWVRISTSGNFVRLLEEYSNDKKAMNDAKSEFNPKPSAYRLNNDFSMENIHEKLAFLSSLKAPFKYIVVGYNWQSAIGDWEEKDGVNIRGIADYINDRGYKAGIWTSPFIADKNSELFETQSNWVLRHADGSVCTYKFGEKEYAVMDVSSGEYLEWLSMTYQRLSAFGYYMHNVDHTMAFVIQKDVVLLDPTMTIAEAYIKALKVIKEAIGQDGYLYVTNGFVPPLVSVADSVQISSSIPDLKRKYDTNIIPRIVNQVAMRGYMSKWWHNCCAPVIDREFTKKFTPAEMKTLLVCEYMTGGVGMAEDLSANDELKFLKLVMPSVSVNTQPREAFDDGAYISVADVEVRGDYHTLCIFNNSFAPKDLVLRLDNQTCGGYVDHASFYNVSSYFGKVKHTDCQYDDIVNLGTIAPNSCEIVKISKMTKPEVILSDMHFSMGGELDITHTQTSVVITGCNRFNCKGTYTVSLPKGKVCDDGRREFTFTVNGIGPFRYEKHIK